MVGGAPVVSAAADDTRAARSAIALTEDHVWMVVCAADASITQVGPAEWQLSQVYGHGMTLYEFAGWLASDLRPSQVLNLDGGLSTQIQVHSPPQGLLVRGVSGTINAVFAVPPHP